MKRFNNLPKTSIVSLYGEPERNHDGFLITPIVFMEKRVMEYCEGSQCWGELPDFGSGDTDILEQIDGLSFVFDHPVDDSGEFVLVSPENYTDYLAGVVTNPKFLEKDGILYIVAKLTIYDSSIAELVESGELQELSQGYRAEIIESPGEYRGEKYLYKQNGFRFNHLALVAEGRNGKNVRILYNSKKSEVEHMRKNKTQPKRNAAGAIESELVENQDGEMDDENSEASFDDRVTKIETAVSSILEKLESMVSNETSYADEQEEVSGEQDTDPDENNARDTSGDRTNKDSPPKVVSLNRNDINRMIRENSREEHEAAHLAHLFYGSDGETRLNQARSLDDFRRGILKENKVIPGRELSRMNSREVAAAIRVYANMSSRQEEVRTNSDIDLNGDETGNIFAM